MRLKLIGDPPDDEARALLEAHGIELASRGGDGTAQVVDGELVLTLPLRAGRAPMRRAAGLAGLAVLGTGGGTVGLAAAAATAAAAQRRARGRRTGPRPAKPRRETAQRIADLRDEGASLHETARILEREGFPAPSGQRWYATTVKRATEAGVAETRIVLRRLGHLLAAVRERDAVDEAELSELGREFRFHHHRLLRAFEHHVGAPYVGRFTPVLARSGKRFRVSAKGEALLAIWQRSDALDDDLEEALLVLAREHDGVIEPARLEELLAAHGVGRDDVVPRFAAPTPGGEIELTEEGREVAETWRRIVDPDPRERLDIDFWPEPAEERRLPPTWDWEDDPLALLGDAPAG